MKDKITAEFATAFDGDKRDGAEKLICPVCRQIYHRRDIETYDEGEDGRSVELCTNCREEFEGDCNLELDSDVLEVSAFKSLWQWVNEAINVPPASESLFKENRAELLAKAIGGETWQSGGGIWLVVKRTTDGRVVTFSDEVVSEYENETAFEDDKLKISILLT